MVKDQRQARRSMFSVLASSQLKEKDAVQFSCCYSFIGGWLLTSLST